VYLSAQYDRSSVVKPPQLRRRGSSKDGNDKAKTAEEFIAVPLAGGDDQRDSFGTYRVGETPQLFASWYQQRERSRSHPRGCVADRERSVSLLEGQKSIGGKKKVISVPGKEGGFIRNSQSRRRRKFGANGSVQAEAQSTFWREIEYSAQQGMYATIKGTTNTRKRKSPGPPIRKSAKKSVKRPIARRPRLRRLQRSSPHTRRER